MPDERIGEGLIEVCLRQEAIYSGRDSAVPYHTACTGLSMMHLRVTRCDIDDEKR